MRTRRITIRCRRTGRSAVSIGTTGAGLPGDLPVPELPPGLESLPRLDLPPVYGTPVHEVPIFEAAADLAVPAYLADMESGGPDPWSPAGGATVVNPWRSNRGPDLTLGDVLARPGRRDLDWNNNPGWPAGIGWAHIAAAARGRSPRHARVRRTIQPLAVLCTGIALVATAAAMLIVSVLR